MKIIERIKTVVSHIYLLNKSKQSVFPCSYRRLTVGVEQMGVHHPICFKCDYRCNGLDCAQNSVNVGLV